MENLVKNIYIPNEATNVFSSQGRKMLIRGIDQSIPSSSIDSSSMDTDPSYSSNVGNFIAETPLFSDTFIDSNRQVDSIWSSEDFYVIDGNKILKRNLSGQNLNSLDLKNPVSLSVQQPIIPMEDDPNKAKSMEEFAKIWIVDASDKKIILTNSNLEILHEIINLNDPQLVISSGDSGAWLFDDGLEYLFRLSCSDVSNCNDFAIDGSISYTQLGIDSSSSVMGFDYDQNGDLWFVDEDLLKKVEFDDGELRLSYVIRESSFSVGSQLSFEGVVVEKSSRGSYVYLFGYSNKPMGDIDNSPWLVKLDLKGNVMAQSEGNKIFPSVIKPARLISMDVSQWGLSTSFYVIVQDKIDATDENFVSVGDSFDPFQYLPYCFEVWQASPGYESWKGDYYFNGDYNLYWPVFENENGYFLYAYSIYGDGSTKWAIQNSHPSGEAFIRFVVSDSQDSIGIDPYPYYQLNSSDSLYVRKCDGSYINGVSGGEGPEPEENWPKLGGSTGNVSRSRSTLLKIDKDTLLPVGNTNLNISDLNSIEKMILQHFIDYPIESDNILEFEIDIVDNYVPHLNEEEFVVVIREKVDATAKGPHDVKISNIGKDLGRKNYNEKVPYRPLDLPHGFTELKGED